MTLADIKKAKLPELRVIARALRVTTKVGANYKTKEQLRSDIKTQVLNNASLLYKDWFVRINSGRTPWKLVFDSIRKYTLGELEELAKRYGISVLHKNIGQLTNELKEFQQRQNQLEQKYERERGKEVTLEEKFHPVYSYNSTFRKAHISFNNIPFDAEKVTELINTTLRSKQEETGIDMDIYDKYVTIHALMSVSSYKKETKQPAENRFINMLPFTENTESIEEKTIEKWFNENDEAMQNIVGESDEYAEIDLIVEFDIYIKYVPKGGNGFVLLTSPKSHPNIFCPETQKFCFSIIMDHLKIKFKDGYTLHQVLNELKIMNGYVPVCKIKKYLSYLAEPVRIILHNVKDGIFPTNYAQCTRIKTDEDYYTETRDIHLGNIMNHYFWGATTHDFNDISAEDFQRIPSNNEYELLKLNTTNPIHTFDWRTKKALRENPEEENEVEEDGSLVLFDDEIQERIDRYIQHDKQKNRPEYQLIVRDVRIRIAIENELCFKCHQQVSPENWTLDRIDNRKGHSPDNVHLACRECNAKKSDNENQLFFWDVETPSQEKITAPYSVGILPDQGQFIDTPEFYQNLVDKTIVFFDKDPNIVLKKFEDWLISKSEEIRAKVNELLNDWTRRKIKSEPHISSKKLYSDKSKQEKRLIQANKAIMLAFCGHKFDCHIIWKSKRLRFQKRINASGIIQLTMEGGYVEFKDVAKITGMVGGLAGLSKSFQIPEKYCKESFPHLFAFVENFNYVGDVPSSEFWHKNIIPDMFLSHKQKDIRVLFKKKLPLSVCNIISQMSTSYVFDFQKVSKEYQILDCVCLCIIYNKLMRCINEITGMTLSKYLTASEIAYDYLKKNVDVDKVHVASYRSVDAWMRQSIQGGKVFPQKGCFYSVDRQKIHNLVRKQTRLEKQLDSYPKDKNARKKLLKVRLQLALYHKFCKDFLHDLDVTSLYPCELTQREFPIGKPRWEHNEEKIEDYLNRLNLGDKTLPLAIVECDVSFQDDIPKIFPILARRESSVGTLLYTFENNQHLIKTSVLLLSAQKHNHAYITKIYNLMIWDDTYPLFRETVQDLTNAKIKAKEDGNKAVEFVLKLMANGAPGKFSQKYHDEEEVISDDMNLIDTIYQTKTRVIHDIDLTNKSQCAVKYETRLKDVQFPVHLNAFMLSYSQERMNDIVGEFDGFRLWANTFYYADTDSLLIHHRSEQILRRKCPNLFGKKLGLLHDDIDEVTDGLIIGAILLAPKIYILEIFGRGKISGKLKIAYHIRAKSIRDSPEKLTFEKFEKMLKENDYTETDEWHFETKPQDIHAPAIKKIENTKITNRKPWAGRLPWNPNTNRRTPFSTAEERENTIIWAKEIGKINQEKIDFMKA